jgi:hypothetical protein
MTTHQVPNKSHAPSARKQPVADLVMRVFFYATDVGFIVYWLVAAFAHLPPEYLFKDYENPILVAWNWSFLPLDLMISATGLTSLWLTKSHKARSDGLAIVSLTLTFCSGLQAIAFWVIRADYSPTWWVMNLYLLAYPPFFLVPKIRALRENFPPEAQSPAIQPRVASAAAAPHR